MRRFVSGLLAAAALAVLQAAGPGFRFERPIDPAGTGPRRLPVDVPLLTGAKPDLSDLRLYDASGAEVQYLLLPLPEAEPVWADGEMMPAPVLAKTSGFELALQDTMEVDAIRVFGLPAPFLKRLTLEGSGDREHWTVLQAEATLFNLPAEELHQTELTFRAGEYRYLRVTWNDTNSGRLPLPTSAQARRHRSAAAPETPLTMALSVEKRPSEPGTSRYRIQLPAPRLPVVAIALEMENERVMRHAVVTEPRLTGLAAAPIELGRAVLKRVVQDSAAAESLRIPILRPLETQLDLTVDDGSNPPLRLRSVNAEFARQPLIYFEAAGLPVVARYGNAALERPRYDLAAARDSIDIEKVSNARWGEPRPLAPETNARPAPVSLARGAPIELAKFRFARPVPTGPAALLALEVDASTLAHSTGPERGFSDVRIVDGGGRQVPYLVEQCVAPLLLELPIDRKGTGRQGDLPGRGSTTEYSIALPFPQLPSPRIVLTTSGRVFARRVTIGARRPADRRHRDAWFETLGASDWNHNDNTTAAPPLTIPIPSTDATDLTLLVEEGDNAPLQITGATLVLPGYRLRFYRGASETLHLVYGRPDLQPPRYDLQLLSTDVLGSPATDVRAAAEQNAVQETAALVSPRVFWLALGIAVVVLLGLVVKLTMRA